LPYYWLGKGVWGAHPDPAALAKASREKRETEVVAPSPEAHLRSTRAVTGYHVLALDGEIGHVEDFFFNDESWEIRYVIINTSNWWGGKRVLISPQWIQRVSWVRRKIYVNLARGLIRKSPQWDPEEPVSRGYELQLHKHYDYAPYWTPLK
jgi:hypothetical protein